MFIRILLFIVLIGAGSAAKALQIERDRHVCIGLRAALRRGSPVGCTACGGICEEAKMAAK